MSASLNPAIRLLSPERRRIYPNPRTGAYLPKEQAGSKAVHPTLVQRAGLKPGQPDDVTWDALLACGWSIYEGKAETDERGYVLTNVSGFAIGDPSIKPEPWGKNRGGVR